MAGYVHLKHKKSPRSSFLDLSWTERWSASGMTLRRACAPPSGGRKTATTVSRSLAATTAGSVQQDLCWSLCLEVHEARFSPHLASSKHHRQMILRQE